MQTDYDAKIKNLEDQCKETGEVGKENHCFLAAGCSVWSFSSQ